jgi:hypothetical protein
MAKRKNAAGLKAVGGRKGKATKATKATKPAKAQTRAKTTARTKTTAAARSRTLPGMEEVRSGPLDNLCEAIAETRGIMNRLRSEEAGHEQSALRVMRDRRLTSYRHAGVELARVPGEEKLRVRTSRNNATAEVVEEEPAGQFAQERADAVEEYDGDDGDDDGGQGDYDDNEDPLGAED